MSRKFTFNAFSVFLILPILISKKAKPFTVLMKLFDRRVNICRELHKIYIPDIYRWTSMRVRISYPMPISDRTMRQFGNILFPHFNGLYKLNS